MLSIVLDIDWYPIYVCVCLSEQIRNSVSRAGFFREIYHFRGQTTEKNQNIALNSSGNIIQFRFIIFSLTFLATLICNDCRSVHAIDCARYRFQRIYV